MKTAPYLMLSRRYNFIAATVILTITSSHVVAAEKFDYKLQDLEGVEYRASDSIGK